VDLHAHGRRLTIIDAHCHAGAGTIGPWPPERTFGRHLRRATDAGIDRMVLLAGLAEDYTAGNRTVARLVRADPARFLGFLFVNPAADRGCILELAASAVRDWGCCGIKVHWVNGSVTPEVGDVARRLRLPVLYDPRGDVAAVRQAALAYPDVAWIIPHLSTFADDTAVQARFIDLLAAQPNVFTDTSGVRYFDLLLDAVRRAGPRKVLFGTDGPYLHPAVELAKVRALRLPVDSLRQVLGGTLLALIRRPPARGLRLPGHASVGAPPAATTAPRAR
jgi:uncharacterized protein